MLNIPPSVSFVSGRTGHLQGIAADLGAGYLYWSFTTELVKTDLSGNLIGSVTGLIGHLGCIALAPGGKQLCGTLELKHDSIGAGISELTGRSIAGGDSFYVSVFDTCAITRPRMDAERDGVMRSALLPEVCEDYSAVLPDGKAHRFGCSGIDGITFAPAFGAEKNSRFYIYVAYGIYGDTDRDDNDDQVLLRIDPEKLFSAAEPLNQSAPHTKGVRSEEKLFALTGNTNYGVQNLEYDAFSDCLFAAVYPGKKPGFPNLPMYLFDRSAAPKSGENGKLRISLKKTPLSHSSGICGLSFPLGSMGLASLGCGKFLAADIFRTGDGLDGGIVRPYLFDPTLPGGFCALGF